MKVLSIKEPFASLIMNGHKLIETRIFKTNYRGKLYIHASKGFAKEFINNDYIKDLINEMKMNHGYIICKVNLVDCVYMDKEFITKIKKDNNEYNLGLYEEGRYAWIFEDVKPITPIFAKGKLNIWNYDIK